MELVLARHAEAATVRTQDGSGADPGLTDRGRTQAQRLADWLAREPIDRLVSSPALRARETLAPLADRLGRESVVDPRLTELDRGATHYESIESMRERGREAYLESVAAYRQDPGLPALAERVDLALSEWASRTPGGRVVVVCHGGVINVFACRVLGLPIGLFLDAQPASSHRFRISRRGVRSVYSLNETAYLERADAESSSPG